MEYFINQNDYSYKLNLNFVSSFAFISSKWHKIPKLLPFMILFFLYRLIPLHFLFMLFFENIIHQNFPSPNWISLSNKYIKKQVTLIYSFVFQKNKSIFLSWSVTLVIKIKLSHKNSYPDNKDLKLCRFYF